MRCNFYTLGALAAPRVSATRRFVTATVSPFQRLALTGYTRRNLCDNYTARSTNARPLDHYTVKASLGKAVTDPAHLAAIREAVGRTHRCTYRATDLLNLYVRDRLERHGGTGLDDIFKENWLIQAYYAVSFTDKKGQPAMVSTPVQDVFDAHMNDPSESPPRAAITQALKFECRQLAATGATNVRVHFQKRMLAYTRTKHALDEAAYAALSRDERRARKLGLMQAAEDVCRPPDEPKRSPDAHHAWVKATRGALGIDDAVGDWKGKPMLYHLKANPHRFLNATHLMSVAQHAAGRKPFALFPLRRAHVPRHVRFDQRVLDDVLGLGAAYAARKAKKAARPDPNAPPGRAPKRKHDDQSLLAEKGNVFDRVLDLKRAGVHRRRHFAFSFTTDGVSLHLNMERPPKGAAPAARAAVAPRLPKRGIHSIDALKAAAREAVDPLSGMHVVGIDPGKRELVVCVDADKPRRAPVVRYTLAQRRRDMRARQYADEGKRAKPAAVTDAEEQLSAFRSKAPSLTEYARFSTERRALLRARPEIADFYADLAFRERRRKSKIKAQQSEARLVKRIRGMHAADDPRQLVLAYGAWGRVAGRANVPGNKGHPPAPGAGLMYRLARDFVVALTPEHYTSKTCVRCGGTCGAHPTLKTKTNREIRGLRVCQHEGCGLLQNRDRTGATNIGVQFARLVRGQPPLRPMSGEELEFERLRAGAEGDGD